MVKNWSMGWLLLMGLQALAMGQHPFQMLAMDLNLTQSKSQHQRWALWPCHVVHRVVPVLRWPPSPETISASALAEPPGFTVLSGDVLGLIGAGPDIFTGSDLLRSLLKASQLTSVDLRGSSFSQLGLEPNQTGLTAQFTFLLRRVVQSKTQWHSNVLKLPSVGASSFMMILFLVGASVVHIGHLKLASYYFVASGGFDCLQKKAHQPFAALRWLLDVFLAVEKFVGFCAGGRPASIWMIVLNTLLPLVGPPCPSRLLPSRLLTKFSAQKEHESSFCGHSISRRPSLRQLINSLISATCNRTCWTTWRKPKGVGRKKKKEHESWSFQSIPLLISSINLKRDGVGTCLGKYVARWRIEGFLTPPSFQYRVNYIG